MNTITALTNGINDLWFWTYGIMAGWGISAIATVVVIVLLFVRTINLQRRVDQLESRLVHAERDYNLTLKRWESK